MEHQKKTLHQTDKQTLYGSYGSKESLSKSKPYYSTGRGSPSEEYGQKSTPKVTTHYKAKDTDFQSYQNFQTYQTQEEEKINIGHHS